MTGSKASIEITVPADDGEAIEYARLAAQALFLAPKYAEEWVRREGISNVRIARRNGRIIGGLACQPMGQWFGGRAIPMAAVRGVAVAPEHRAAGVAQQLMAFALQEARRQGLPISVLYPATKPVYARSGYETAGVRIEYRIPTHALPTQPRDGTIRPIEPGDHDAIRNLRREFASRTAGNLERNEWYWRRILDPPSWMPLAHGYVVESSGRIEGYLAYNQIVTDHLSHSHELSLADVAFLTPRSGRRLLAFLAAHRSIASHLRWSGGPADPLVAILDEPLWRVQRMHQWMLRIADLPAALAARGYPPGLTAEIHFDVVDDVLSHNNGRFVLVVVDGAGRVEPGGKGIVHVTARGLAALYTGHRSLTELKTIEGVEGDDKVLASAGVAFAGPAPWMSDMF